MTHQRDTEERISLWLEEEGVAHFPDRVLDATFEQTRKLRQAGSSRWRTFPVFRSVGLMAAAGAAAVVLVVVGVIVLRTAPMQLGVGGPPTPDPRTPFLGTWISTSDAGGGTQTMAVERAGNNEVEVLVTDTIATVCDLTPSTMTGTGTVDGNKLVIPTPDYRCDDGSEPQAISGPPLNEQLRNLTYTRDAARDVLAIGEGIWRRPGAAEATSEPTTGPTAPASMWPQSTMEEVRDAQERADAGDPRYAWQVDPELASDDNLYPWDSEIVERFVREELGWEEFVNGRSGVFAGQPGGPYHEVVLIRCAPGRTNPLYPNEAFAEAFVGELRGCAPTIGDSRYETVRIDLEQPGLRGPSGVWVVTGWETLQPVEPSSFYEHLYPHFELRQVEQVAPPPDAEVNALLQAFLRTRVGGEGAEQYVHRHPDGFDDQEVPIMYATTGGSPYERYEVERVRGPVWPSGWIEFRIHLFAEDGTEVEQTFIVVRQEDGRLGLMYGLPFEADYLATTENGQGVPVPYSILDGEVTFTAAPPWSETSHDGTSTTLGGVGRGSAVQLTMFTVMADPRTGIGCEAGPPAADVDALVRSIRSNPDVEATDPVALSVGGINALRMEVVGLRRLEVGDCRPMVLERLGLGQDDRMRLYLLDLPVGMSARVLAIAINALPSEFERVVEAAAPILDSFEFHTP